MNSQKMTEYPEHLMLRDTGFTDDSGGLGQRIYTNAGAGYAKQMYVRSDLARGFTAGDIADQGAKQFAAGYAAAWKERAEAAESEVKVLQRRVEILERLKTAQSIDMANSTERVLRSTARAEICREKLNELLNAAGDAAAVLQNKVSPLEQETTRRLYAALNAFQATMIGASPKGGSEAPTYTTGHCENHKKPGGCPLHNLQCGYPQCDRQMST